MEVVEVLEPVIAQSSNYLCSCVKYLIHKGVNIPSVSAIWFKNFNINKVPTVGSVAVFQYGEGEENHHIALVIALKENGFVVDEANYEPCEQGYRLVPYNDTRILGFFTL